MGQGEEFIDPNRNRGIYQPVWVEIGELPSLDVPPKEIAVKIHNQFGSQ